MKSFEMVNCLNKLKSKWDEFIILIYFTIVHIFIHTNYWDDLTMKSLVRADNFSIWKNIVNQWYNWSSRIVVELVMDCIVYLPDVFWRIINIFLSVCLYIGIRRIVSDITAKEPDTYQKGLFILIYLSIPYSLYATAGWMVTTICYLWIFNAFVFALLILIKAKENKMPWKYYIYFSALWIYFCGYDISAVIGITTLFFIWIINRNSDVGIDFRRLIYIGEIIALISTVLVVICPGNWNRNNLDAQLHDASVLLELGAFGKVRMGVNTVFYHFISIPNIFLLFTLILFWVVIVYMVKENHISKFIASLTIVLVILWTIYCFVKYSLNKGITYLYPDGNFNKHSRIEQYLAFATAVFVIVSLLYNLWIIISNKVIYYYCVIILLFFGIMPQIALGFTTTVSTSGIRNELYLYLALIFVNYVIISNGGVQIGKYRLLLMRGLLLLAGSGALFSTAQLVRHIMIYG